MKKLRLDGVDDKQIAKDLGMSAREVRSAGDSFTPVFAVPAGLRAAGELAHVEAAVDQVVKAWSGVDPDELWDWARIYDGEHGLSVHGHFAFGDDVTQALNDVGTHSRRLHEIGLTEEGRSAVLRALRLAQARARAFGADDTTIHARMAPAH